MHRILFILLTFCDLVRADPAADGRVYSLLSLRKQCIELSALKMGKGQAIAQCAVSEFAPLGTVDRRAYYYALYCLTPKESTGKDKCEPYAPDGSHFASVVIFSRDEGSDYAKPIMEHVEDFDGLAFYQTPAIVSNPAGTFLLVPIRANDTGAENLSAYYRWQDGEWQSIDATAWLADLKVKPPYGKPGDVVWPDLKTMTAEVPLFRAGDPSCCASGGTARVKLTVDKHRLRIDSVTFSDAESKPPESSAQYPEDFRPPPQGSPERKAILDSVRPLVEDKLKQPVNFIVRAMPITDDWAVALLEPVTKEGKPIDWTKTPMASKKPGLEWEPFALALLKKEIGRWTIWEFALGTISQGLERWPKKYPGAPGILFEKAAMSTNCEDC